MVMEILLKAHIEHLQITMTALLKVHNLRHYLYLYCTYLTAVSLTAMSNLTRIQSALFYRRDFQSV